VSTLPQRKSGVKELRKNRARKLHNLDIKTHLKKTIKKFLTSVEAKNIADAQQNLKIVYKQIDKAAKRNLLPKNTASRRKSLYSRKLASIKS
jgi:small subunit ribosomal protein S20